MGVRLLESGVRRERSFAGALPSIVLHAGLLGLGIYATTSAGAHPAATPPPAVIHVALPGDPGPKAAAKEPAKPAGPKKPAATHISEAPPALPTPAKISLSVEVKVPTTVPVGVSNISTSLGRSGDFSAENGVLGGGGHGRGTGSGSGGGGGGGSSGYFNGDQVDEAAYMLQSSPRPVYPEPLRALGTTGNVLARFVIDTTGRFVPSTFQVVSSDNPLFTAAVRRALERSRYMPGKIAGAPVRQLVQQQFTFTLTR